MLKDLSVGQIRELLEDELGAPGTCFVNNALKCCICFALPDDLVNDARERCGSVDDNTLFRNVSFRFMQSRNEFPFRLFSAPLIFRSLIKPPVQCVKVDLKDKNAVK